MSTVLGKGTIQTFKAPPEHWRRQLIKLPWLLLLPMALWLKEFGAAHNAFIESDYSTTVYPILSQAVNFVFRWIPLSAAELILYLGSAGILIAILVQLVLLVIRRERLLRAFRLVVNLSLIACVGYFLFVALWGLNYYRQPLAQSLDYPVAPRSVAELKALCVSLADDANRLRAEVPEDGQGHFVLSGGKSAALLKVPAAYQALSKEIPLFSARYGSPKPVLLSRRMSYTETQGIFIPFTMEPNVNVDMPDAFFASTACHEEAHLYGFAREDEANFISYLACMASGDPEMQYSGTLLALATSMNALSGHNSDAYWEIENTYSDGVKRDLWNHDAYWDQFKGPVAEASTNVNNSYLKSNKQADGVNSYGRMVDLLLAMRAKDEAK